MTSANATTIATAGRVLVATRISVLKDKEERSRIERDDVAAQKWAEDHGYTVVAVSKDAGVSGTVDPWKRKGLGPYLTDTALMAQYDIIVASSIDRLGRSARDLNRLKEWAEENGKVLMIRSPELRWPLPTDMDPMTKMAQDFVWMVLGKVAEVELELMKIRAANVRQSVEDEGGFIGRVPFGFVVVGEKYRRTIAPDQRLVPYLQGMVERALRGDSLASIGRWLNDEGVIPVQDRGDDDAVLAGHPLDHAWSPTSARQVLQNAALKGRRLDAAGKVTLKFDGIMSSAEWDKLQKTLGHRPSIRGRSTSETALLTGVIECSECRGPMYRFRAATTRKDGTKNVLTYYRCKGPDKKPSTCKNMVSLELVEAWLNSRMTHPAYEGGIEAVRTLVVPGDDHTDEIAEIEAAARELDPFADNDKREALRAERDRLTALPSEPAQIITHPTGVYVAELWRMLDDHEKRSRLLASGMKLIVKPGSLRSDDAPVPKVDGDVAKIGGAMEGIALPAA